MNASRWLIRPFSVKNLREPSTEIPVDTGTVDVKEASCRGKGRLQIGDISKIQKELLVVWGCQQKHILFLGGSRSCFPLASKKGLKVLFFSFLF